MSLRRKNGVSVCCFLRFSSVALSSSVGPGFSNSDDIDCNGGDSGDDGNDDTDVDDHVHDDTGGRRRFRDASAVIDMDGSGAGKDAPDIRIGDRQTTESQYSNRHTICPHICLFERDSSC